MSTRPQLLVCMRTEDGPPSVPSTTHPCNSCQADVYVSDNMLRHVETSFIVCEKCSVSIAEDMGESPEVEVDERQRAELRELFGVDDAGLDRLVSKYNKSLFGEKK